MGMAAFAQNTVHIRIAGTAHHDNGLTQVGDFYLLDPVTGQYALEGDYAPGTWLKICAPTTPWAEENGYFTVRSVFGDNEGIFPWLGEENHFPAGDPGREIGLSFRVPNNPNVSYWDFYVEVYYTGKAGN